MSLRFPVNIKANIALGVAVVTGGVALAPMANALPPGPFCPGDGTEVTVFGIGGGYCDMLFMPDGAHVHCEWGGAATILVEIASVSNCWRVNPDGTRVGPAPLVRDDPWTPPPTEEPPAA